MFIVQCLSVFWNAAKDMTKLVSGCLRYIKTRESVEGIAKLCEFVRKLRAFFHKNVYRYIIPIHLKC